MRWYDQEENEIILSADDYKALCDAIENPKPPTEALRKLLAEARKWHQSTITPALDAAIQDEIEHGPKDIMK